MTDSTPPQSPSASASASPSESEVEPTEAPPTEDDRRAAAAAVNRKRALEEWEANKKRWRDMGVPTGLPAKK